MMVSSLGFQCEKYGCAAVIIHKIQSNQSDAAPLPKTSGRQKSLLQEDGKLPHRCDKYRRSCDDSQYPIKAVGGGSLA
jgi:hypothetical protein